MVRYTSLANLTRVAVGMSLLVLPLIVASCSPGGGGGDNATIIDSDTTLDTLAVHSGRTVRVRNNAVVTVSGDATIDGTLEAEDGRVVLMVSGNVTVNGTVSAMGATESASDQPLNQQSAGIYIVVSNGAIVLGDDAVLQTTGNYVLTDDADVLTQTPQQLYEEVEDLSGDNLPTFVPLPPENEAFTRAVVLNKITKPINQQGGALDPIVVTGTWPPAGAMPPSGDAPVVILRFHGPRDVILRNWRVTGPTPSPRDPVDSTDNPAMDATGPNGRRGLNLNMRNEGGAIRVEGVVTLNLADGGAGSNATAVCASATGGDGGAPGNLRMSAADGIDMTAGTLEINPGRGGAGGSGIVNAGSPGADGCPGMVGNNATARGGNGARNEKALFVRGNVEGVENVIIGTVRGGNGGAADATACDGGNGEPCCDGGAGGQATAIGGRGGNASLNLMGIAVLAGGADGGMGGEAAAYGGLGGVGGECKFDDGGNGGAGGMATATGGAGGDGTAPGAGTGGVGGDANATGGDGGDGGASGFGDPGEGGAGGTTAATPGAGGVPGGTEGQMDADDGLDGLPGGVLPTTVFCFEFGFIDAPLQTIEPGTYEGPVFGDDNETEIGTMEVGFVDIVNAQYLFGFSPDHIGITGGELCVQASTLQVDPPVAGVIGGLRIAPLYDEGINVNQPLVVMAMDANGEVIGTQSFSEVPLNIGREDDPEYLDATFDVDESIAKFTIVVPDNAFVTIFRIYLLDP